MYFAFKQKPCIAIIGDIKESKKIEQRAQVQRKLNQVLEIINKRHEEKILSRFVITLGDEFQGVLANGSEVMPIVLEIERGMFPVKIRFGIGIGNITTDINPNRSIGADGPGYYKARQAIEELKRFEKSKSVDAADIRIAAEENRNLTSVNMLNTILSLMTAIKELWSDRQREIIWEMLEYQDGQKNIAERMGIRQPTVQKSLAKGHYYAYKDAVDMITEALREIQ